MNRAQFNISSFLKNGALLSRSPDQFNLITGPFSLVSLEDRQVKPELPVIYQPHFWDFLQTHRQTLFVFQGERTHTFNRLELLEYLAQQNPKPPSLQWQAIEAQAFKKQFDWSQAEFASNRLQKTVPIVCQRSDAFVTSQNLAWMLLHLVQEELPGWTYGFWQNRKGYLGQTPELIADWNEKTQILKTAAVAGTLKNTVENEVLIQVDQKICDEHDFVVADISTQLKKTISEKQIFRSQSHVQKLKHLLHLKTDFECKDVNLQKALQIIQNLHPTAALGIYPRREAEMQTFAKFHLQDKRNTFAAPFAFVDKQQVLCVAGIRNIFFSENEVRLFSGCGVTAASDYESELSELQLKRDSVKKMMGLLK